ncbi:uncharacterized protein BDR25DRAFT_342282 [Lindgomyces ingoldianus]|uniref:Uncharacterized protein n=1 Tax=Lindgomyces ingoldianus TaxID=673940 RepID=A0ACB6QXD4_9PLEO|nr:uncharacterized protein BDR25DRAFT_342282 [Lindgomyces ingoldianus]KAF2471540.1 hypothetical protein BDR25DRAFT_342282 [Lindgomyces ingoldianus]
MSRVSTCATSPTDTFGGLLRDIVLFKAVLAKSALGQPDYPCCRSLSHRVRFRPGKIAAPSLVVSLAGPSQGSACESPSVERFMVNATGVQVCPGREGVSLSSWMRASNEGAGNIRSSSNFAAVEIVLSAVNLRPSARARAEEKQVSPTFQIQKHQERGPFASLRSLLFPPSSVSRHLASGNFLRFTTPAIRWSMCETNTWDFCTPEIPADSTLLGVPAVLLVAKHDVNMVTLIMRLLAQFSQGAPSTFPALRLSQTS